MAVGIRIRSSSGKVRLDITDRLTRIVQRGSYQPPAGGSGVPTVFIAVPDMSDDGTWIVALTGPNIYTIQSGGFSISCFDSYPGNTRVLNYYAVYRF